MNPDEAMKRLADGNARFMSGRLSEKDVGSAREASKEGQHPFVTILTCSDSRVCPELIFDANIGELFVIRNAGNVVDKITLGSIEYGTEHLHTPLLVVLGHERCGAVTAACQGGKCSPNIRSIMGKIKASARRCGGDIEMTCNENMKCVLEGIRAKSGIVRHLESEGKLKIAGMKYYFSDGRVENVR